MSHFIKGNLVPNEAEIVVKRLHGCFHIHVVGVIL